MKRFYLSYARYIVDSTKGLEKEGLVLRVRETEDWREIGNKICDFLNSPEINLKIE